MIKILLDNENKFKQLYEFLLLIGCEHNLSDEQNYSEEYKKGSDLIAFLDKQDLRIDIFVTDVGEYLIEIYEVFDGRKESRPRLSAERFMEMLNEKGKEFVLYNLDLFSA